VGTLSIKGGVTDASGSKWLRLVERIVTEGKKRENNLRMRKESTSLPGPPRFEAMDRVNTCVFRLGAWVVINAYSPLTKA